MHHRRDREDRHRLVEEVERVRRVVEEHDVAQAQHQPGHRHREQGEQPQRRAQRPEPARLLEEIRGAEHEQRADERGPGAHLQAVEERRGIVAVDERVAVMLEREREVVGLRRRAVVGDRQRLRDA